MQSKELISIVGPSKGPFSCSICLKDLAVRDICILLRKRPGGAFDPICVDCSHRIVEVAAITLAVEDGSIVSFTL